MVSYSRARDFSDPVDGGMKNIQIIDGALDCTYSLFQVTDEEFALLFPEPRQDIQYAEDLALLPQRSVKAADDGEMRFLAFYAPGEFKTVWADPGKASAWRSTGLDINGYETLNDQKERRNRHAAITFG
jgi:hypothetical protein